MSSRDRDYNPTRRVKQSVQRVQQSVFFNDLIDDDNKFDWREHKRPILIMSAAVLAVLTSSIIAVSGLLNGPESGENEVLSETIQLDEAGGQEVNQQNEEPEFDVVIPRQDGQQTRYDSTRDIIQYVDEYKGQSVRITQQPAPKDLISDPDQLEAVAKTIPDGTVLDKIKNPQAGTFYVSRSNKRGDAATIMYQDLLIFINIDEGLSIEEWSKYVTYLLT